jgi:hypothetical protein
MKAKTDGDIVRIANRIDDLRDEISDLIDAVESGGHPNAAAIASALWDECYFAAWANHVVIDRLAYPERWACHKAQDGTQLRYYHEAARKAHETRRKGMRHE